MDDTQELERMAEDPDLVVSVEFEHGRYHALIGDKRGGYRAQAEMSTFAAAVRWLQHQAHRFYPKSKYVRDQHIASST